jgi:hypothetical protein
MTKVTKTIYPKCLFSNKKAKATYISHDGYVRPCCYVHRHNRTEKDEPWMVELRHNIRSGDSLEKMFSTPEYTDFFNRLKTGKNIPYRCYEICGKRQTNIGVDHRKEKIQGGVNQWVETKEQSYEDSYKVQHKLQVDLTHRCSLGCPKCNRFIVDFKDHISGMIYKVGHQVLNKVELSIDDFKKIFKENPQMRKGEVDFCGTWSDAIYHPHFIDICRVIKDNGASINIATNGSRKKSEWWDELYSVLNPKTDSIVFAMDGLKDTAGIYRKFIIYNDVMTAITKGVELQFVKSRWSFIVFNFNQHQVYEAEQLAKKIGITFEIVKSHRWDGPDDPLIPSKEWLPQSIIEEYNL